MKGRAGSRSHVNVPRRGGVVAVTDGHLKGVCMLSGCFKPCPPRVEDVVRDEANLDWFLVCHGRPVMGCRMPCPARRSGAFPLPKMLTGKVTMAVTPRAASHWRDLSTSPSRPRPGLSSALAVARSCWLAMMVRILAGCHDPCQRGT